MSNILETNVLIIGKSGVGKSSLLNYIFDKEVMKTGTGRPVTEKGIFTEKLRVSDEFVVNLSDTWGIEANKAMEWEKLIKDEVKKHDCEEISSWFHTIFFCISAKSARVEDFEKSIIKSLIDDGNKVIVVLTHSDTNNINTAIEEMSKELSNVGLERSNIIKVCSVGKKLLGGRTTQTFGKEAILHCIKSNLWETICNKLPKILDKIIDSNLNYWYSKSCELVDNEIKWYNSQSNKKLEKVGYEINKMLDSRFTTLELDLKSKYNEAYDYYFNLTHRYQLTSMEKQEYSNLNYNFNFKLDIIDKLAENITRFIFNLIPFAAFFTPMAFRDIRKDDIKAKLKESRDNISYEFKKINEEQIENMKKYIINNNV